MTTTLSEYMGYPVIQLRNDKGTYLSFGISKANLILSELDAIKAFVVAKTIDTADEQH